MRSIVVISLVLAAGPVSGAQMSDGSVSLEVSPQSVSAGGALTLTLINRAPEPLGYNLCSSALERQAGATWELVPTNRFCTMVFLTLKPAERAEYPLKIPASLSVGEYRYSTNAEWLASGKQARIESAPFQVR